MKIFNKNFSYEEKVMSVKALLINSIVGHEQISKKGSLELFNDLYGLGVLRKGIDSSFLQDVLRYIENEDKVLVQFKVSDKKQEFTVAIGDVKVNWNQAVPGQNEEKNGLCVAVDFDDEEFQFWCFTEETNLKGDALANVLNTEIGKRALSMVEYAEHLVACSKTTE